MVPVEEGPECPERREHDEPRGHGLCNPPDLLLGGESLGSDDVRAIRSNDAFKRRDHEGEWQTRTRSAETKIQDGNILTPCTQ